MQTLKELHKRWDRAFIALARERGLRTVSGFGYLDDGAFVAWVGMMVVRRADPLPVSWAMEIKPIGLDDILWEIFLPELELSPARRRSQRVDGAYAVRGIELAREEWEVAIDDDPEATITAILDTFTSRRSAFLEQVRSADDVVARARAQTDDPSPHDVLRETLALMSAGRPTEAADLLRAHLAKGETGPMRGPAGGVFEVLLRHLENPPADAATAL